MKKTKIILEVTEIVPPAGQEYLSTAYPGPGIYYNPTTSQWFLVYVTGAVTCVVNIGQGARLSLPHENYLEPCLDAVQSAASVIQAEDLLKAIAISQNPLLAKELLK